MSDFAYHSGRWECSWEAGHCKKKLYLLLDKQLIVTVDKGLCVMQCGQFSVERDPGSDFFLRFFLSNNTLLGSKCMFVTL